MIRCTKVFPCRTRCRLRVASLVVGSALFLPVACLNRPVATDEPRGTQVARMDRAGQQEEVDGYDLLFVVDDSISMADKQAMLQESMTRLHEILLGDRKPIFPPARSLAIISTSLEAAGACPESSRGARPTYFDDDKPNPSEYTKAFTEVGDDGCGFEAPLEAMYRFLVDPSPPATVEVAWEADEPTVVAQGVDAELLQLRERFLAPYSQVIIVILTDEDDCSLEDTGGSWRLVHPEPLPRGSSACEVSPDSVCCRSCDVVEAVPPDGCAPLAEDPVCQETPQWSLEEDVPNLRCFDQKRRFGQSGLFPISRYVDALTSSQVHDRDGVLVQNPLFAHGRTKDMVTVLVLAGTPWQLIATEASDDAPLQLLHPANFAEQGTWDRLLGAPGALPDPHLLQATDPRPDLPLATEAWDPIHGHEIEWPSGVEQDLQYSCVFDLPEDLPCAGASGDCLCHEAVAALPVCRSPEGTYDTIQRRGRAYPPRRLLELARGLGERGLIGSICPRSTDTSALDLDYGYAAAFALLAETQHRHIGTICFEPPLPVDARGMPLCHVIEAYSGAVSCEAMGRIPPHEPSVARYRTALVGSTVASDSSELSFCELPAFSGSPAAVGSPYEKCQNELHPDLMGPGYCYIDPRLGLGTEDLVAGCHGRLARRLRFIPHTTPVGPASAIICDYGE